jgi:hypothetical protein
MPCLGQLINEAVSPIQLHFGDSFANDGYSKLIFPSTNSFSRFANSSLNIMFAKSTGNSHLQEENDLQQRVQVGIIYSPIMKLILHLKIDQMFYI